MEQPTPTVILRSLGPDGGNDCGKINVNEYALPPGAPILCNYEIEDGVLSARRETQFGAELSIIFRGWQYKAAGLDFLGVFEVPGSGPHVYIGEVANRGAKIPNTGGAVNLYILPGGPLGGFGAAQNCSFTANANTAIIAPNTPQGGFTRVLPNVSIMRRVAIYRQADSGVVGTSMFTDFDFALHIAFAGNST